MTFWEKKKCVEYSLLGVLTVFVGLYFSTYWVQIRFEQKHKKDFALTGIIFTHSAVESVGILNSDVRHKANANKYTWVNVKILVWIKS